MKLLSFMSAAFEIEKAVVVGAAMARRGYFLHLSKAIIEKPFTFTCDYPSIGK